MSLTLDRVYTANYSDNVQTTPVTIGHTIPVGSTLVVHVARGTTSGTANGVESLSVAAGALGTLVRLSDSRRASTVDVNMVAAEVTTAIPAGTILTITHRTTAAGKRGAVVSAWTGITLPLSVDATSGIQTDPDELGGTSIGPNGSGTAPNGSTLAATTAGTRLVLGAISVNAAVTVTDGAGWIRIGETLSISGTSDRGVVAVYRISSSPETPTVTATYSSSIAWAVGVAAVPAAAAATPAGWQYGSYAM